MEPGTRTPSDGYGRPAPRRAPEAAGEPTSPVAEGPAERAWPTDTQVWDWARGVAFAGYGPSPSDFL
ncbi:MULTISPECIES: hypothetical protein [unclassified Streptomyces]|uniref:hypothetical protein n=1 Tax=unclassified Streptomyces TaxID=2593676 RepID=UPI0036FA4AF1